ncbi:MAG: hypothetical protein V7L11_19715 [Nostoc sp.]
MSEFTKTLCPYCGVGCGLEISPPSPDYTFVLTSEQPKNSV